jgi:putative Mg2+ transporter-C (MgtC) family protein
MPVTTLPIDLTWGDVALRLALATIAGALVGFNRSEQGKAAGMRTTLLVCLAATLWLMTVVGLCFGGGQIGLGLIGSRC